MTRRLSGHPQEVKLPPPPKLPGGPWVWVGSGTNTACAGPWGITFALNLTPDEETGLYSEEMFIQAIRNGKSMGVSRPIMPPMPWHAYSRMTDEDLKAVYAYLKSLPPISNLVPGYLPPDLMYEGDSKE